MKKTQTNVNKFYLKSLNDVPESMRTVEQSDNEYENRFVNKAVELYASSRIGQQVISWEPNNLLTVKGLENINSSSRGSIPVRLDLNIFMGGQHQPPCVNNKPRRIVAPNPKVKTMTNSLLINRQEV